MTSSPEIAAEQAYVDILYARLDALRERAARQLTEVRRSGAVGTPQARSERDAFATLYENRLAQLRAVEDRLCFGRLDLSDGARRYVGRIGLSDDARTQLLVDWRAPAARTFYQATAASPEDVVRRRHLSTRRRTVTGVEDEVLDLDLLDADSASTLTGEGALLASLDASRTGRMRDIVATIQSEQDRIIRSDLPGVLVVQGGPGTGKTAVALHRAAYLLYTHRERLARSGVLLVGPSPTFLRYIEQVLPSLGETGVVLSTVGDLLPGVTATAVDADEVAGVKGDLRMAQVVAAAVEARQRVPRRAVELVVDGHRLVLRPQTVLTARGKARQRRKPHNEARSAFLLELLDDLGRQLARARGMELDPETRADLRADLRDSKDVRRELNLLWMPLTPQSVLTRLYADPAALGAVGGALTPRERRLLRRSPGSPWTTADVPLLDEIADLLGDDGRGRDGDERAGAWERQRDLENAAQALRNVGSGMVTAEMLAERFTDSGPTLSVAERAASDRTWTFGHVVVDEAQELSPMAWRMLMRRCPSRSMTVVGDLAQTGSAAGARSWGEVLDPYVQGRWRLEELTVNYRTPRQIMDLAATVLRSSGSTLTPPRSVREGTVPPRADRVVAGDVVAAVVRAVGEELVELGDGRLAVLTPATLRDDVTAAVAERYPDAYGTTALESAVTVLGVAEAKGLEVDVVVLLEPGAVAQASTLGLNDLYVALTRPTQRLRIVHSAPLPAGLTLQAPAA